MSDGARAVWARTRVLVWPARYVLASLPRDAAGSVGALLARAGGGFAAVVLERDEVSLTIAEGVWAESGLRARAEATRYRAITLDVDIDLAVVGYLAPAAARLAAAGVSIVPQCAFLKDHLLVREQDLEAAVRVLEELASEARA